MTVTCLLKLIVVQESKILTSECEQQMVCAMLCGWPLDRNDCFRMQLEFVRKYTVKGKGLLCGNSVHVDRMFLGNINDDNASIDYIDWWRTTACVSVKEMPRLMDHLHYRIIDVSSIRELAWRWMPDAAKSAPRKKNVRYWFNYC